MADRRLRAGGAGPGEGVWPVLLVLLAAVVVPTACVLWFMTEAMSNERLAVRQKLTEAYRTELAGVGDRLDASWRDKAAALAKVDPDAPAGELFANLVRTGHYDSVVIYDRSGRVGYPVVSPVISGEPPIEPSGWAEARQLEYEGDDAGAAAARYAAIAEQTADVNVAARALAAEARCLAKAGRTEAAIDVLARTLAEAKYRDATGPHGRLIVPNAQLHALELMGNPRHGSYRSTVESLVQRVTDYSDERLSGSQRRFLMHQLQAIVPDCPPLPTRAAEDLAADYLDATPAGPGISYPLPVWLPEAWQLTPASQAAPRLGPTPLRKVWQLASADKTVVALFREDRIVSEARSLVEAHVPFTDVSVELTAPTAKPPAAAPFLVTAAAESLPNWQLVLQLKGENPLAQAADRRVAAYLWTGVLVILVITALALVVARYVTRQMKLTRLKNDLIATVSHELKTPLSSMRLLGDTLLEGHYRDEQQVREYLQLMAKENARLSHLIDNFLTFSRMERNKRAFEFGQVKVEDIVTAAVDTVREKFEASHCRLDVQVSDHLPTITGDRDALVTVVLNLLDNAYKYSEDEKRIVLRAYAADGNVCLEVQDNGIGLSRRALKRIFTRFYQVDQSLSRRGGGCGLGLSIVKFIVEAHGGAVAVASQPGRGSTFTVKLPVN